jgi:glycosyltransferase involved in cell wall biosynthesis
VIVTAHDRRRYLIRAVESLLDQALPRDRFEILVVKNFADEEIDRFLTEHAVEHWVTTEGPLTGKLLEALARSRGKVIAFLEDDDLYRPERLAVVEEAFQSDPNLGFFRNGFAVIDEEGRPFHGRMPEAVRASQTSARDLVVSDADKERGYPALVDAHSDFNISTMAVRRDLLEGDSARFRRLGIGIDRFLFYAALVSTHSLRLDPRRLTAYRIHTGNTGIVGEGGSELLGRLDRIMAHDRADEATIYELVRDSRLTAARRDLEGRRVVVEAYGAFRQPSVDRRGMMHLLRQFPRYRNTEAVRVNHRLAFECAVYVVSPGAARRLHQQHLNRWLGLKQ